MATHISHVREGGRINETRIIKLWRNQKGLDFPSFYLELTVINALSGQYYGMVDPANTNNIISDDLTAAEEAKIKWPAEQALKATNWSQIVL